MLRSTVLLSAMLVLGLVAAAEAETPQETTARLFVQKVSSMVKNCAQDKQRANGNPLSFHTAFDCNCFSSQLKALRSEDEFENKKISWRPCFDETALSQSLLKVPCAYTSDCACVSAKVVSALANSDVAMTAQELPFKWMGNLMALRTAAEAACKK